MIWRILGMAAAVVVGCSAQAEAAATTRLYTVTATDFVNSFGTPTPVDPVQISFRLRLDPAVEVSETETEIALVSSNLQIDGGLSYDHYVTPSDYLDVGGTISGLYGQLGGTNDFLLSLNGLAGGHPTFFGLSYRQTGLRGGFRSQTGSVTVADVPEPGAWALMLSGFGGIGATLRRRRRWAVA